MKQISLVLLATIFILSACNDNKPTGSETPTAKDSAAKEEIAIDKTKAAAEGNEKTMEELGKLTPLELDKLKTLLPATLMGAAVTDAEATNNSGAGTASGEYEVTDSSSLTLTIIDCAGSGGAGIYNMQFAGMANSLQETAEEYTKSIDINGGKGFEHCDKTSNECAVVFFTGNRFLVTLEGDNIGAAALKQVASVLKIK